MVIFWVCWIVIKINLTCVFFLFNTAPENLKITLVTPIFLLDSAAIK